jgi:hypothetical protein
MSNEINYHVNKGNYKKVVTHGADCSVLITTDISSPIPARNLLILNYEFFGKQKTFEIGLGD